METAQHTTLVDLEHQKWLPYWWTLIFSIGYSLLYKENMAIQLAGKVIDYTIEYLSSSLHTIVL